MRYFLFLGALLVLTAAKNSDPKPFVVKQYACKDKGLCETIVIENPLMKPVLVEVSCGPEYDKAEVQIPARSRYSIDVEVTTATQDPVCKMTEWKVVE